MKGPISNLRSSNQGNHIGKGSDHIRRHLCGGYYNVVFFVKVPIGFEGIPGEDISSDDNKVKQDCTDDIFERRQY